MYIVFCYSERGLWKLSVSTMEAERSLQSQNGKGGEEEFGETIMTVTFM